MLHCFSLLKMTGKKEEPHVGEHANDHGEGIITIAPTEGEGKRT